MTNPFLSTPEATAFWREQQQACEEARRLLVKTPEFGAFLAAGGTLAVVSDGFPISDNFAALLKDGDSVYACIPFFVTDGDVYLISRATDDIKDLTAWLTEARDGVRELPTVADIARARIAVEVHDAPKRLEANNERPKYDIYKDGGELLTGGADRPARAIDQPLTKQNKTMTDAQFKKSIILAHKAFAKYKELLQIAEDEYTRRFGIHPSDADDDYWIDVMHHGAGNPAEEFGAILDSANAPARNNNPRFDSPENRGKPLRVSE